MTTVRDVNGQSHLALKPGAKPHQVVLARCGHWVTVAVVLPDEPTCPVCTKLH